MNYCIDLILGNAFCTFIFFHFPDSRLSVWKGFHFYFCFLTWVKTENFRSSLVTFRWSDSEVMDVRKVGPGLDRASTAFVRDVLSVLTFSYLKCLHSWHNISNFRKIFVAEGNSYIFFVPFSYEHFTFHVCCVFSHDVMAAIFVSQSNETAAMLVFQTNPVGVESFSYVNAFFCSNKFA